MTQHNIQIELEGLIKLLAQNLYANPDVFLREMIQNAHDAIIKRAEVANERDDHFIPAPEIRVDINSEFRTLTISDNGAGLTEQEIHDYIATIGRSGTGELRESLMTGDRGATVKLIGQFGIGLLSAFIVADSIVLTTRSPVEGGYKWISSGNRNYDLEPCEKNSIGTTAILHLGKEHARYLEVDHLRRIIRTYANVIGIPIYLNKELSPANEVDAPWHRPYLNTTEFEEDYYSYWEKRFRPEVPLDVWPLATDFTYLDDAGDLKKGEIRGVLGITDRRIPGIDAGGIVDIFISRMFITTSHTEVLPSWARFIQGVVECSELVPNAARDDVIRNDALNSVRHAIGKAIIDHLTYLFKSQQRKFTEIMRWHSYQILAMCALEENKEFFDDVSDLVPLKSNQGLITIPQYLEKIIPAADGRKNIHYIIEPGTISQYYLLCESQGISVFDASESYAEIFLERYAKTRLDQIRLNRLDVTGSDDIFEPISEEELPLYEHLESEIRKIPNVMPRISRFTPKEVPALLTQAQDAQSRAALRNLAEDLIVPSSIRDKIKEHIKDQDEPMTLHVNADNPIIARLSRRPDLTDEIGRNALISLYNNALMLHSKNITPNNIRQMFEQYNKLIESVLTESDKRGELEVTCQTLRKQIEQESILQETEGFSLAKCITCFVAMPFGNHQSNNLYKALEQVLEDEPFFWNVVRADEEVNDARLWENVERQMSRAHCFIAEVTTHNPNVMIEIGRMEVFKRPLLLLKQKDSQELPADIRERLYVEHESSEIGETLIESLREQILKQQRFCQQQGERYLSEVILRKIQGLDEQLCRKIAREFETCDDFLNVVPDQIAPKFGVNPLLVRVAQEGLLHIVARYVAS
jgi:molecular chaperone HtpG